MAVPGSWPKCEAVLLSSASSSAWILASAWMRRLAASEASTSSRISASSASLCLIFCTASRARGLCSRACSSSSRSCCTWSSSSCAAKDCCCCELRSLDTSHVRALCSDRASSTSLSLVPSCCLHASVLRLSSWNSCSSFSRKASSRCSCLPCSAALTSWARCLPCKCSNCFERFARSRCKSVSLCSSTSRASSCCAAALSCASMASFSATSRRWLSAWLFSFASRIFTFRSSACTCFWA
mmetsp:Transcript_122691/g.341896  ORF Transcript_122691/g.341896 Transcript_122691/m.341896 type:complete len:240 (+) Transcript_122691:1295-2014(+)